MGTNNKNSPYTIHVTVPKFIHEGGKLRKGREIYYKGDLGYYYPIGDYQKVDKKTSCLIIRNTARRATFQSIDIICYVEIPVTPIYK